MLVYGPVRHRDFTKQGAPTWRPTPESDPTYRTVGWDFSEDWNEDSEDFLLRAEFLSKRVHMVEYVIKDTVS